MERFILWKSLTALALFSVPLLLEGRDGARARGDGGLTGFSQNI